MAVIGKIRQRSMLVIIVLGVALVGFILGEGFLSGQGASQQPQFIAEINGEEIPYNKFLNKVDEQVEIYKKNAQTITVPDDIKEQIREQVWNDFEQDLVVVKRAKDLGLSVTGNEFVKGLIQGKNPHPAIAQNFGDPQTGQFNPATVSNYIQNLENDETGEEQARWNSFEEGIQKDHIKTKYLNMLKKGLYTTNVQAKLSAQNKSQSANISYVTKRFSSIENADISFTDADLQTYYNAHKNDAKYQATDATRSIKYVSFNVTPTAEDKQLIRNTLNSLKVQFKETKDDTLFVSSYASKAAGSIRYYTKNTIPASLDTLITQATKKQVIGPVLDSEDGKLKLLKILDIKQAPDSAKASHIFVRINNGDTLAAQAKIDSLYNLIQSGMPFEQVAATGSEDQETGKNGGDLGWFQEGRMLPVISDFAFNGGEINEVTKVESSQGLHIIKITDLTEKLEKRLVATIDKQIVPSRSTIETAYNLASKFSLNNSESGFEENAKGLRDAAQIKESDKTIRGLGDSRDLVRWVFEGSKGDVSEPFELEDRFVVAKITETRPKGTPSLDLIKTEIEQEVIKQKKAEKLIEQLGGNYSLQTAATKWSETIKTADNVTFGAYTVPGLGAEKEVIGATFALKKGEVSKPIVGEFGVFLIKLENLTGKTATEVSIADKTQLNQAYKSRVDYQAYNVLKEKSDITDNRSKFF